jgi:hypothetical protein
VASVVCMVQVKQGPVFVVRTQSKLFQLLLLLHRSVLVNLLEPEFLLNNIQKSRS